MAGFLRKKLTLSRRTSFRDAKPVPSSTSPERLSSDVPPSLPPLLLSTSFADPDPDPRVALPPSASPPVIPLAVPESILDDCWDPWKAYTDARHPAHTPPSAPPAAAPPASNAPVDVPNSCNTAVSPRPSPVATVQSPRQISTRQVQTRPKDAHPKCDALGNQPLTQKQSSVPSTSLARPTSSSTPAVARGQMAPTSSFDFEESLSALSVTSVVNQGRSYPPIRHHTSPATPSQASHMVISRPPPSNPHRHHTAPQKSRSSSSLSSSSHHTDATRRTNGSYGTSTSESSVSPAAEVIDIRTRRGRRLDPVSNSHPAGNATAVDSRRLHRPPTAPSAPPTSYQDCARTLARRSSHSNLPSSTRHTEPQHSPMLYDTLRSGNPDSAPLRRGPLIFAAISATHGPVSKTPMAYPNRNPIVHNPYPSPPTEYASLEPSAPLWRNSSISSVFRGTPQVDPRSHEGRVANPTEPPPLHHKSSKSSLRVAVERTPSAVSRGDSASEHARPRVLTKARPTTPQKQGTVPCHKVLPEPGDSLLLDDDPFARVGGVKMLKPRARSSSGGSVSDDGHVKTPNTPPAPKAPLTPISSDEVPLPPVSSDEASLSLPSDKALLPPVSPDEVPLPPDTPPSSVPEQLPPSPVTPDDYKTARRQRRGQWLEKVPPPAVAEMVAKQQCETEEQQCEAEEQPREPTPPPTYFPIMAFMSDANLLLLLLSYLSYSEWLQLYSANKQIQDLFQSRTLREFVLERYLCTIGYSKWNYEWAEPLALSLKDLHNYLRGVAMPTHQYARLSAAYLQPQTTDRDASATSDTPDILALALTTRAYTRVVLRLRAQAESEARYLKILQLAESSQATNTSRPGTRQHSVSSRAPSPTSSYSHSRNHSHGKNERSSNSMSPGGSRFRSPLYRLGRAPVLRVFVPSPEGDWLSDASIVECEDELRRSGVLKLLRVGDIVWDVAVGDEGNLGRLIWDGSYLVDLDYRYSRMGELSPYFHSLAFAPSYFHRVIRIGSSATHNPHCNPLVYVDVSPWGREIATNLQLLQDRARTETPHGALHDVVRWVHRSTFTIRPPLPPSQGQSQSRPRTVRVPIPNVEGFYIDSGWYGKVVLESEGTNEGLVDLQARCGPGVFPPRAESFATKIRNEKEKDNRRVWRILREKSRPGEIWLRAVQVKERLM